VGHSDRRTGRRRRDRSPDVVCDRGCRLQAIRGLDDDERNELHPCAPVRESGVCAGRPRPARLLYADDHDDRDDDYDGDDDGSVVHA
jgi:hypothetical protein